MKNYILNRLVLFITILMCSVSSFAQNPNLNTPVLLKWNNAATSNNEFTFHKAYVADNGLPLFQKKIQINNSNQITGKIINPVFVELTTKELSLFLIDWKSFSNKIKINTTVSYDRKKPYGIVSFVPLRKNTTSQKIEKLISFDLEIIPSYNKSKTALTRSFVPNSVLNTGDWYKIKVTTDGIYKISYQMLKNIGIDVASIDPTKIAIYGNGGKMLPHKNSMPRQDDLLENAIEVKGESDGTFNSDDYILFYGQQPHRWIQSGSIFVHEQNIYSDSTYYFLTIKGANGKRIQHVNSTSLGNGVVVNSFNDYQFHEREDRNLIKSGKLWFGEQFNVTKKQNFSFLFSNIDVNTPVTIKSSFAARSFASPSSFILKSGDASSALSIAAVPNDYLAAFAAMGNATFTVIPNSSKINIAITFNPANSSANGWLDYLEVNARRNLVLSSNQLFFRDLNSLGQGIVDIQLAGANGATKVWDVTDPGAVVQHSGVLSGGIFQFSSDANILREFVAFKQSVFPEPLFVKKINNQNLHADAAADLVIISHPKFLTEANQLAEFHQTHDNLRVVIHTPEEVYNEFSSGSQDLTAIKDYMKMLYDNAGSNFNDRPKYLLLVGDGSYDLKHRIAGNSNYIPTFQAYNSFIPTSSYVTDDYYGLLDDNESDNISDIIDIGIGRLPIRTKQEAQQIVNKIIDYDSNLSLGAWRNQLTFVGDDENGNIHMKNADELADTSLARYPTYNQNKIYLDAFKQESSAAGQRYPEVNIAINKAVEEGSLLITYVGHGGELGWANERILQISQINAWENKYRQSVMLTATCEFSRFDDPQRTSAGELVLLNPNGGSVALLTTTRVVYSFPNQELARTFFEHFNNLINGKLPRLGDLGRVTKANGSLTQQSGINYRNFTLLGDPALRLVYPKNRVISTAVQVPDTISALSKVSVTGYVADANGNKLTDFNGVVRPIVFDKKTTIKTLNNDANGVFTFQSQKNIIFKGKSQVINGDFKYEFVVPKDINYTFGNGRISYYADNGKIDAAGYFEDFIVGGTDANAPKDSKGPTVDLFMNDESFVVGGLTDESPSLYAKVFDDNGINVAGLGIGHDIVAVLDKNTKNKLVLNDYFQADVNSFQKGKIVYPFNKLAEGQHTLSLKIWDVYNNSSETTTDFIVAKNAKIAINHLLNYPNPFTTNTSFYFEHNQAGQGLDVRIQIFTISGKLIKTIDTYEASSSFRVGPIRWNGLDDFGDKIGKGVYVYQLRVISPSGEETKKYEKLVILN